MRWNRLPSREEGSRDICNYSSSRMTCCPAENVESATLIPFMETRMSIATPPLAPNTAPFILSRNYNF